MKSRLILLAVAVLVLVAAILVYFHFRKAGLPDSFQGWVEADFVFVSPDEPGRVETLFVREGTSVAAGQPLFALDDDLQRAAVNEAEAALANAKQDYDRASVLAKSNIGTQKTLDAAQATLRTAEARLSSAKTKLDRRQRLSPATGIVQEVYFRKGEMVEAGRPIVSLMPPQNIKVRFFVPQAILPGMHIDDQVRVSCDGCPASLTARISFISAQAEFSPPVIYSLEERARLVFRVEAIPDQPGELRVGQPASVSPIARQ
ncbi:MAG: HlyD family secretion protein [Hyphomicrobiaceae bacterium]